MTMEEYIEMLEERAAEQWRIYKDKGYTKSARDCAHGKAKAYGKIARELKEVE